MTDKSNDYFGDHERGKLRRKWIEALRSGEYKQNPEKPGFLGDKWDGYCCLGVACEAIGVRYYSGDPTSARLVDVLGLYSDSGHFCQKDGAPPLLNRYDVTVFNMEHLHHSFWGRVSLTGVNDETSAGFKRIADWIERHPERVFSSVE